MLPGLFTGLMGGGHAPGHGATGGNLLGTALGKGVSLKTIKSYFPSLVPEAKRRIKARKRKSRGR